MIGLFCAVLTFFAINYLRSTEQIMTFRVLLLFSGMFIGGPAGIIGSTISAELVMSDIISKVIL